MAAILIRLPNIFLLLTEIAIICILVTLPDVQKGLNA